MFCIKRFFFSVRSALQCYVTGSGIVNGWEMSFRLFHGDTDNSSLWNVSRNYYNINAVLYETDPRTHRSPRIGLCVCSIWYTGRLLLHWLDLHTQREEEQDLYIEKKNKSSVGKRLGELSPIWTSLSNDNNFFCCI